MQGLKCDLNWCYLLVTHGETESPNGCIVVAWSAR